MTSPRPDLTMLTFAPMIDSECTRLVLCFHKVLFVELDRLFGWVSLLTVLHGGYGRVPLVYGKGMHVSGPRAMARHLDGPRPDSERLDPREQPLEQLVEDDFATYNNDLALDVAAFAYFWLLPQRDAMIESFGDPITPLGRSVLPVAYGPLRLLFRTLLRLNPSRIADVKLRIESLLDWTDSRLADGRQYLHGGRVTLADLALMSAMAPILVPDHYARHVPPIGRMPEEFQTFITRTRSRASGHFVLGLYHKLQG
jgi:glutathione S-transferase